MKIRISARRVAAALLALAAGACADPDASVPLPTCGVAGGRPGTGVADTLEVRVRVGGDGPTEVLARVDPPGESNIVFPEGAPPGAAAAGISVIRRGLYQICVSPDTEGFGFDAPATPYGRAWLRVTTRRPVRVRLEAADGEASVTVMPGASGRTGPVGGLP